MPSIVAPIRNWNCRRREPKSPSVICIAVSEPECQRASEGPLAVRWNSGSDGDCGGTRFALPYLDEE